MTEDTLDRDWSLKALRSRNRKAIGAVVSAHLPALLAGALAVGLSRPDAEEAVQDTFVVFLEKIESFEGRSSLRTYLFSILYHKALHIRAKAKKRDESGDIEAVVEARFDLSGSWLRPPKGPEAHVLDAELIDWVKKCADNLPASQRAAFFLKEIEGATTESICNILGVSGTNLRVMLHRARLKLRECLELNWGSNK